MERNSMLFLMAWMFTFMAACGNYTDNTHSKEDPDSINEFSVLLPEQCTYEVLIDSSLSKEVAYSHFFLIYGMPYLLLDSIVFPVWETNSSEISIFMMPDNICPDDICFNGHNSFWFTKGDLLGHIIENKIADVSVAQLVQK